MDTIKNVQTCTCTVYYILSLVLVVVLFYLIQFLSIHSPVTLTHTTWPALNYKQRNKQTNKKQTNK